MKVRVPAILPRFLILVAVWLLGTSTLLLAKGDETATEPEPAAATETAPDEAGQAVERAILLVPDVRGLPYVFAKGVLEDGGFAWRVEGKVEGYAVNLVAEQSVPPGAEVVNTGAPTVILTLRRSSAYEEVGLPDERSPFPGTKVVMAGETADEPTLAPTPDEEMPAPDGTTQPTAGEDAPTTTDASEPSQAQASTTPTTDVENAAETQSAPTAEDESGTDDVAAESAARPPAFVVPGAPREPLDEMPLPRRAEKLDAWLDAQSKLTPAGWDHYTYQHSWIVTGASFGWWHGAEALRILIRADEALQKRFDTGAALERAARKVLAQVEKLESQAG
ncbi:MAG: PASTA domain-containing protein [Gaiellales bacterium]